MRLCSRDPGQAGHRLFGIHPAREGQGPLRSARSVLAPWGWGVSSLGDQGLGKGVGFWCENVAGVGGLRSGGEILDSGPVLDDEV